MELTTCQNQLLMKSTARRGILILYNVVVVVVVNVVVYFLIDRDTLYLNGGVLFVTSRILVVDLLKKVCPVEKVSGVLVYNAHKLVRELYHHHGNRIQVPGYGG